MGPNGASSGLSPGLSGATPWSPQRPVIPGRSQIRHRKPLLAAAGAGRRDSRRRANAGLRCAGSPSVPDMFERTAKAETRQQSRVRCRLAPAGITAARSSSSVGIHAPSSPVGRSDGPPRAGHKPAAYCT